MASKDEEQIIVVPRAVFAPADNPTMPQGFFSTPPLDYPQIIARHYEVVRRGDVEQNPALKQIIPYVIVTRKNGAEVFLTRRLGTQDESRLHDLLSLGIGGHIRSEEGDWQTILELNLQRELHEELCLERLPLYRLVGYVNDDSNSVGQVHLGLVFEANAEGMDVAIRETELMEGSFVERASLVSLCDQMETWSSLITRGYLCPTTPSKC